MNKITKFILRKISKNLVVQGPTHEQNIVQYFSIMREAAHREFTEDSPGALDEYLYECLEKSKNDI